jgi:hypothetical protein
MDFELIPFRRLAQAIQVKLIVFITSENVLPIVAPLNDVLRLIFDEKSLKSRHYSPPLRRIVRNCSRTKKLSRV